MTEREGHRERLRARYLRGGLESLDDREILELLLFYAIPRVDTAPVSRRLLERFGSLAAVLAAPGEELRQVEGVGGSASALLTLVGRLPARIEREALGRRIVLTNYLQTKAYCRTLFRGEQKEALYLICLNSRGALLHAVRAVEGSPDRVAVSPRSLVEAALRHQAHSVLLAHNHPGGSVTPSAADLSVTARLREVFEDVDIRLLDHLIVSGDRVLSVARFLDGGDTDDGQEEP